MYSIILPPLASVDKTDKERILTFDMDEDYNDNGADDYDGYYDYADYADFVDYADYGVYADSGVYDAWLC